MHRTYVISEFQRIGKIYTEHRQAVEPVDRICRGDLQNYNFHQVSMPLSHAEEIILCILYAIIFIANIVGNLFVCAIVLKTKKLQNFTNILIVNMAVRFS